jgi:Peptidase family M28
MNTQRLMEHMRALCISPRPTGSREEARAADYVRVVLQELGIEDVRTQPFQTIPSSGWTALPLIVGLTLGALRGRRRGGALMLAALYGLRRAFLVKPLPFDPLLPKRASQNVIARIPPRGAVRQMVFLVGHLDSNKQRFSFPFVVPSLTKPFNTAALVIAGLAGVSLLLTGRSRLQGLTALLGLGLTAALIYDETQPYVEGANDNATAVAALLGIAEALTAAPLEHTEVTLLFTGSEETGCNGLEAYLKQYAPPKDTSTFIDIEMVGTGDLCYITKHGISHFSEYRPAPHITALAARVAREHPEFRVTGKAMTILEETASLRNRGCAAICIAGYDSTGMLPHWHRVSDTLDHIEPQTLIRAADYVHTLITELDTKAS